ncbi:MAG: glutathione S-transferase family protein [Xanthomonadaceae bacterium]|jgi:glutathione S-transferase|nr:glutathione S-transferase family protein [Xanthomonadaceae bacterium]
MQLIGTLFSPYVRRTAIALRRYGVAFDHKSLSPFDDREAFARINPVLKAPTLVLDDGQMLTDSGLILDYFEFQAAPERRLLPADITGRAHALRVIGLALTACEKAVQIVYELKRRPEERRYPPLIERSTAQVIAAGSALEKALEQHPLPVSANSIGQAGITLAVAWTFTHLVMSDALTGTPFPRLDELTRQAEALPVFVSVPSSGTIRDWAP